MADKDYFITSIPMVELQEDTHIPTVVYYSEKGKVRIGYEAKAACKGAERDVLNEDFKIDIGKDNPAFGKSKRRFKTGSGIEKSAGEITGDFLDQLLRQVREWLPSDHAAEGAGIIVAEPLTMQGQKVDDNWLGYYRQTIKRILLGKGFSKDKINFMPEPFAVFQYYKYGVKHPLLGKGKQRALVLDFGGGSFDVCIVESDKEGEVTGKMRNTRPLGAASAPIGGFFINRVIAEKLYRKYATGNKPALTNIGKGLKVYRQWRDESGTFDPATVKTDLLNFARNFHNTIYDVEDTKLALCNAINDWKLDTELSVSATAPLPKDPFESDPTYFNASLNASEFRDAFIQSVWNVEMRPIVKDALERGGAELDGAPITVVLLSGGSCNIKWVENLLMRDFATELSEAQILQLEEDFQEVVAKGVAVESARRFYDDNQVGDFTSITYNRLHLILDPDETTYQLKQFFPEAGNPIPPTRKLGVLIPSASVLRNQFDKPLTWRVQLDKPPRRHLDYYFLRKGFDPIVERELKDGAPAKYKDELSDLEYSSDPIAEGELEGSMRTKYSDDLLNLEHRVYTPNDCSFDSSIAVELVIEKETKTAKVKFIYARETPRRKCISVEGKPFFLDMTDTQDNPSVNAYIGLDFGTSNTSVSYISQSAVKTYQRRATDRDWLELNDLYAVLPYPLAVTLAKYLRVQDPSQLVDHAREFVEAALAMAAYVSYLEMCVNKGHGKTYKLKGFTQRSVGPLWGLLRETLNELRKNAEFAQAYKKLMDKPFYEEINQSITYFGEEKHEKADASTFNPRVVKIIGNVSREIFSQYKFGFFEGVQQERFKAGSFKGRFRLAYGSSTSFIDTEEYSGSVAFPNSEAYLVDFNARIALPLYPLVLWYSCEKHTDEEHCYFYDKPEGKARPYSDFSFKAVGFPCSFTVSREHEILGPVADQLTAYTEVDQPVQVIQF
jgi:molecular chaperone DnaK (HSP70)